MQTESITPAGLPPHILSLKIGSPIMVVRNLKPPKLCNGTRLQITNMRPNLIEAIIITGSYSGETVFIPRIPMIPSDLEFEFKRLQFPIRLAYAMTINKSQGQSLKVAGIYLILAFLTVNFTLHDPESVVQQICSYMLLMDKQRISFILRL